MNNRQLEKAGIKAVRSLRKSKLKNGFTFMINTETLPSHQCYLEYPNKLIVLASLHSEKRDFKILTKYSLKESNAIRKKLNIT